MACTELEEAKLVLSLKKLIISQARLLYGPDHPSGSTFDIVLQERNFGRSAWLVVFTSPGSFTKYQVLKGTHSYLSSDARAVTELWRKVKDVKGLAEGRGLVEGMVVGGEKEGDVHAL